MRTGTVMALRVPDGKRIRLYYLTCVVAGGCCGASTLAIVCCCCGAASLLPPMPLIPSLKPLSPSPRPLPSSGSLRGPKTSSAMTRMIMRWVGVNRLSSMALILPSPSRTRTAAGKANRFRFLSLSHTARPACIHFKRRWFYPEMNRVCHVAGISGVVAEAMFRGSGSYKAMHPSGQMARCTDVTVCARIFVMRRREFLQLSVLASGASFCKAHGLNAVSKTTSLRLTIDPHVTGHSTGADFTGLSYESQQLGDPTFFSPDNAELVALVRRLGKRGVLRIGGNTSEYCYWTPNPTAADLAAASAPVNPSTGRQPDAVRKITPQAIKNLRKFIDATGWTLIYGLNLGTGKPETAAEEAAYVMKTFGPKLVAFQLGNEPNLFPLNGLRKKGYSE